jgi:hypothetical protein
VIYLHGRRRRDDSSGTSGGNSGITGASTRAPRLMQEGRSATTVRHRCRRAVA